MLGAIFCSPTACERTSMRNKIDRMMLPVLLDVGDHVAQKQSREIIFEIFEPEVDGGAIR